MMNLTVLLVLGLLPLSLGASIRTKRADVFVGAHHDISLTEKRKEEKQRAEPTTEPTTAATPTTAAKPLREVISKAISAWKNQPKAVECARMGFLSETETATFILDRNARVVIGCQGLLKAMGLEEPSGDGPWRLDPNSLGKEELKKVFNDVVGPQVVTPGIVTTVHSLKLYVQECLKQDPVGGNCQEPICLSTDEGTCVTSTRPGPMENWQMEAVKSMANAFLGQKAFNGEITYWKTGQVTDMHNMFKGAESFNQDLSGWLTHNVETMKGMFMGARKFRCGGKEKCIAFWKIPKVEDLSCMFASMGKITFSPLSYLKRFGGMNPKKAGASVSACFMFWGTTGLEADEIKFEQWKEAGQNCDRVHCD